MSKWRPTQSSCIYVVSSVKGSIGPLRLICNRILPLRKTDGVSDQLVLLGNYIGDGKSSYDVIEYLIKIKQKYKDKITLIRGEQEENFLNAVELKEDYHYDYWISHGGKKLAIEYMNKAGLNLTNPYHLQRSRLKSLVSERHVNFIESLSTNYTIFTSHGGYSFSAHGEPFQHKWKEDVEFINVFGECKEKKPYLSSDNLSLDAGSPDIILAIELNSMESFIAKPKKRRMIKYEIKEK